MKGALCRYCASRPMRHLPACVLIPSGFAGACACTAGGLSTASQFQTLLRFNTNKRYSSRCSPPPRTPDLRPCGSYCE